MKVNGGAGLKSGRGGVGEGDAGECGRGGVGEVMKVNVGEEV